MKTETLVTGTRATEEKVMARLKKKWKKNACGIVKDCKRESKVSDNACGVTANREPIHIDGNRRVQKKKGKKDLIYREKTNKQTHTPGAYTI